MTQTGLVGREKLAIGLAGATQAASGGMLGTALVVYVGRSGSPFAVSMLATVFFVSTMVCSPLWGAVGDVVGRRRALIGFSALTAAVTAGFLLVDGVWALVGLRGLRAAFAVAFGPLILAVVRSVTAPERRGRAVGFASSTAAAGDVGAQLAVGVLLGVLAPSELYAVVAAISLGTTALVALVEDPTPAPGGPLTPRELARRVREQVLPDAAERARLRRTGLTWLYAGLALRHLAVKGVGSLVPLYLVDRLGVSTVVMGGLLALGPAAQIAFMPLFGRRVDDGDRVSLVVGGIALSGLYPLALAAATFAVAPLARTLVAAGSFLVIAAGFSAMDLGTVSLIGDSVPASRESAFVGFRTTAAGAGGVLGPALVGATATLTGFPTAFALVSAFAFAAAALVWRTVDEPARATPPGTPRSVETTLGLTHLSDPHHGADDD